MSWVYLWKDLDVRVQEKIDEWYGKNLARK
jgi:hypothetical protein